MSNKRQVNKPCQEFCMNNCKFSNRCYCQEMEENHNDKRTRGMLKASMIKPLISSKTREKVSDLSYRPKSEFLRQFRRDVCPNCCENRDSNDIEMPAKFTDQRDIVERFYANEPDRYDYPRKATENYLINPVIRSSAGSQVQEEEESEYSSKKLWLF